jgi:hypothetical protein
VPSLPSGLAIPAVLNKSVDSKKAKQGDEVTARTAADVLDSGKVVVPRNTKLIGHVTEAKAKANGESESTLGIVFDKAVFKNGQSVPLQAGIQALAAPAVSAASSTGNDDAMGGGSAPRQSSGGGNATGGVVGAVGSTAGGAVNTAGNAVGNAGGAVGNTAGNVGSTVGSTAGAVGQVGSTTAGATGALSSTSTGVIGMKGLQLNSATSGDAAGSVITSAGKNVKLDSGSQMVLKVTGSGQTQ